MQLNDISTGSPTSWYWDFGDWDLTNATVQNPVQRNAATGIYTVSLTATNDHGSHTISKTNYINVTAAAVAPITNFMANKTSGNSPLNIKFTDKSTGNPTAWAWDFNSEGLIDSNARIPVNPFIQAGTYTVKLTVWNASGSDDEVKLKIIYPPKQ